MAGGGSTLTFLKALEENGAGHLWGVEAHHAIYDRMLANLKANVPGLLHRFTPLLGFSDVVLPEWIAQQPKPLRVDVVFLDGGDNPMEQIREFEILDPFLPVGARFFSHDAHCRKGKFIGPFLAQLDNWQVQVHDYSTNGLLDARKIAAQPSPESRRRADARLKSLRSSPLELVGRVLTPGLKAAILRRLPRPIVVWLKLGPG
jgi:hypothetical protein